MHAAIPPRQYEFAGHAEHTRFVELVQAVVWYVPSAQAGAHVSMASPPVQYEFAGQDTHILLVVLLHAIV